MKPAARPVFAALRGYSAQAAHKTKPAAAEAAKVSRLPNGAVVATVDSHSPVSHVSVSFNAGSRHEDRRNEGVTHCIRNAVNLTTTKCTGFHLTRSIQQAGGDLSCSSTKEQMTYSLSCLRDGVEEGLELVGNAALRPAFKPWELQETTGRLNLDLANIAARPDTMVMENLHSAAYRDGLGNPLYMPAHRVGSHSSDECRAFTDAHMVPANMAVVGVGVDHDSFVYHLQHRFGFGRDSPAGTVTQAPKATYFGGESRVKTLSPFVHAAIVTEGVSLGSKDMLPLAVLQKILGTGPYVKYSDNANSPLVKAASQLTTNPFALSAVNINYSDSGLFGFYAVMHSEDAGKILGTVVKEVSSFTKGGVDEASVARGKALLKSALLYDLENGANTAADMATQALLTGQVLDAGSVAAAIDAVTVADVADVAKKVINNKPSMSAVGNLVDTPYLDQLL